MMQMYIWTEGELYESPCRISMFLYYHWSTKHILILLFCEMHPNQKRERERDAPVVASPTPLMRLLIKYESSCVCRGLGDYWIAIVVEELSSCCSIFMYNVTI